MGTLYIRRRSAPGSSTLDVQVPAWAMPQIVIVTYDLWIKMGTADATLLHMAVPGFLADEGDGTTHFAPGRRFKLDDFARTNYPGVDYRWIELCSLKVATEKARASSMRHWREAERLLAG